MNRKLVILVILSILACQATCLDIFGKKKETLVQTIKNVQDNLKEGLFTKDQPFKLFPHQHETEKGIYRSDIKLNFIDKTNSEFAHLFRKLFGVVDNNMFVTNFVVLGLIEASELGYLDIDMESLESNIDALLQFQDKNYSPNVPIYNFWSQIKVDEVWQSSPRNIEGIMNVYNKLPNFVKKAVEAFGYKPDEMTQMVNALRIPSDNDDSGCNLALGATLRDIQGKYANLSKKWEAGNNDYKTFYKVVKKYAYRPFDTNHTVKLTQDLSQIEFIY